MMKGWKTWAGAIGIFCSGIVLLATGLTAEPLDPVKCWEGVTICAGAFAAVGIGHKIEKNQ